MWGNLIWLLCDEAKRPLFCLICGWMKSEESVEAVTWYKELPGKSDARSRQVIRFRHVSGGKDQGLHKKNIRVYFAKQNSVTAICSSSQNGLIAHGFVPLKTSLNPVKKTEFQCSLHWQILPATCLYVVEVELCVMPRLPAGSLLKNPWFCFFCLYTELFAGRFVTFWIVHMRCTV